MQGIDLAKTFGVNKQEENIIRQIMNGQKPNITKKQVESLTKKISKTISSAPPPPVNTSEMTNDEKIKNKENLKKKLHAKQKLQQTSRNNKHAKNYLHNKSLSKNPLHNLPTTSNDHNTTTSINHNTTTSINHNTTTSNDHITTTSINHDITTSINHDITTSINNNITTSNDHYETINGVNDKINGDIEEEDDDIVDEACGVCGGIILDEDVDIEFFK